MNPTTLTLEELDRMLDYNPTTGEARWTTDWMVSPRQRGKLINNPHRDGYYRVTLRGVYYPLHRLIWFLYYGEHPRSQIGHRNGDKSDNRIANLVEARTGLKPPPPRDRWRKTTETRPPWE